MFQPVTLFIGHRYSKSSSRRGFVSFITFFSVAGILLGVMSLIIVVSVMNGFESELKKRILGLVPHLTIEQSTTNKQDNQWLPTETIIAQSLNVPEVIAAAPYIDSEAFVQSQSQLQPVLVQGIFPDYRDSQTLVAHHMQIGKLTDLKAGEYGVVLGAMLARKLGVHFGDRLRILLTQTRFTPMGRTPLQRTFVVTGIFHVGSQIDEHLLLVHGSDLARLLRRQGSGIDKVKLTLSDAFLADDVAKQLAQLAVIQPYQIESWRQSQGKLFAAVKMEKNMMWMMLSLIIAVAAFNIVSALVMVVNDKQGEIGILKTLGMNRGGILRVFMTQGLINGAWGATLGTAIGVLITLNLNGILSALGISVLGTGYGDQALPVVLQWSQVAIIWLSAILMTLLATLYPASRASSTQPAEVLKNE